MTTHFESMPTYEIEQYELHAFRHRVRTTSRAEAIKLVLDGKAMALEETQEFIEVADRYGLPVTEHAELCFELRAMGVTCITDVIPSIREIEEVDAEPATFGVELFSQEQGLLHSDPVEPPQAPKLCVVLESEFHGRESFDRYADLEDMLAAVKLLVERSIESAARDGIERTVGIAIIPPADFDGGENEPDH